VGVRHHREALCDCDEPFASALGVAPRARQRGARDRNADGEAAARGATKLLAKQLHARAIADPEEIREALTEIPEAVDAGAGLLRPTPEDAFKRLGRKDEP
jgi:hypothetical protein